ENALGPGGPGLLEHLDCALVRKVRDRMAGTLAETGRPRGAERGARAVGVTRHDVEPHARLGMLVDRGVGRFRRVHEEPHGDAPELVDGVGARILEPERAEAAGDGPDCGAILPRALVRRREM